MKRAIDEDHAVTGYYYWSLIDNFEWAKGYAPRFGLIQVDYDILLRTPKQSFHWYRARIASNGESLERA